MKEKDTSIRELFHQPPTETLTDVSVSGWVRTVRDSKTFGFVELNDGTFFKNLQVVLVEGRLPNFKDAVKLNVGSAVRVTGVLELTPGNKQPFDSVRGRCLP